MDNWVDNPRTHLKTSRKVRRGGGGKQSISTNKGGRRYQPKRNFTIRGGRVLEVDQQGSHRQSLGLVAFFGSVGDKKRLLLRGTSLMHRGASHKGLPWGSKTCGAHGPTKTRGSLGPERKRKRVPNTTTKQKKKPKTENRHPKKKKKTDLLGKTNVRGRRSRHSAENTAPKKNRIGGGLGDILSKVGKIRSGPTPRLKGDSKTVLINLTLMWE